MKPIMIVFIHKKQNAYTTFRNVMDVDHTKVKHVRVIMVGLSRYGVRYHELATV